MFSENFIFDIMSNSLVTKFMVLYQKGFVNNVFEVENENRSKNSTFSKNTKKIA